MTNLVQDFSCSQVTQHIWQSVWGYLESACFCTFPLHWFIYFYAGKGSETSYLVLCYNKCLIGWELLTKMIFWSLFVIPIIRKVVTPPLSYWFIWNLTFKTNYSKGHKNSSDNTYNFIPTNSVYNIIFLNDSSDGFIYIFELLFISSFIVFYPLW